MSITIKQIDGITFVAKGNSNHWVAMDANPQTGGSGAASSPMEFLLFGLGGCTAVDVVMMLNKRKKNLKNFEIQVESKRADAHPKVYTEIHLTYKFWGEDLTEAEVKRAIELSKTKYCSASAMLGKTAKITYEYRINPPDY